MHGHREGAVVSTTSALAHLWIGRRVITNSRSATLGGCEGLCRGAGAKDIKVGHQGPHSSHARFSHYVLMECRVHQMMARYSNNGNQRFIEEVDLYDLALKSYITMKWHSSLPVNIIFIARATSQFTWCITIPCPYILPMSFFEIQYRQEYQTGAFLQYYSLY